MHGDNKPVLIYDGKCGFCSIWIDYWRALTGESVRYARSQEVAAAYPEIPESAFRQSVQLVYPDGEVRSGARAVFSTLSTAPSGRWLLWAYEHLPGFANVTEFAYRIIAAHRTFFYWLTVMLFGRNVRPLRFDLVQKVFRICISAVYLLAFVSFGVQSSALIGSRGVLPVSLYLSRIEQLPGLSIWTAAPSLLWLNPSDQAVQAVWIAGAVFAVLAATGYFWRLALAACFALYLSLFNASQEFLTYQWDSLLLEAGFLSIFLSSSRVVVWLFRWLLFRLMFLSGAVKLLSGDLTWRSLTALKVHFETQPLPASTAWYVHHFPSWLLEFSCAVVFAIELLLPILIFAPRRARRAAAAGFITLQVLILLTGNYAFFNWLTIALCLFLFDDAQLETLLRNEPLTRGDTASGDSPLFRSVSRVVLSGVALLSTLFFIETLRPQSLPGRVRGALFAVAPFGVTSTYGLFAAMTTTRPEIVVEGSKDGVNWMEYEFRFKPGSLRQALPWVAPHQPRLDWQMWFAALGSYQENVWFLNLLARLLQAEPVVLSQLSRAPFGSERPQLVRAMLYQYKFTDPATRVKTGETWQRTMLGLYVPPVTLNDLSPLPIVSGSSR